MDVGHSIAPTVTADVARRSFAKRWLAVLIAQFFLSAILVNLVSATSAQPIKVDPVDEKALRNSGTALGCARGTINYGAEKAKVEEYFVRGLFPEMTRYEPAALGKLGDKRYDLFRRYLWATSNSQMQSDITGWALAATKRMAVPGYHPAVRYNAVLIIGMLDREYAIDGGANQRSPKPLPEANDFLIKIVNAGAGGSKAVPPALVAAALIGLERHAKYRDGLSREAVEATTAAALKIATQDKPMQEMPRDVHTWLRLQAASVLVQFGSVGANNQVHDALITMIANGRSIDDRCATAALFPLLKYDGAKVDGPAATQAILTLARDVAEAEAKRAEEFRDMRFTGGGGGFSGRRESFRGGFDEFGGGSYSGEQLELEDYPRRHILTRLSELKTGLTALKPVVPAEAQKQFDTIVAAINPAMDAAANKNTVSLNVASAVVTMAGAITAITGTSAPATATDEEAGFAMPEETPPNAVPAAAAPAETEPAEAAPAAAAPATE